MDSFITHFLKRSAKKHCALYTSLAGPPTQRQLRRDHTPLCKDLMIWLSTCLAALTTGIPERFVSAQCSELKGGSRGPSMLAHPNASWQRSAPCHVGRNSAERCTIRRR